MNKFIFLYKSFIISRIYNHILRQCITMTRDSIATVNHTRKSDGENEHRWQSGLISRVA